MMTLLNVENLQAYGDKGNTALNGVSFSVAEGEIFGAVGVAGNGQKELAEVLTGIRHATKGKVFVNNYEITNFHPRRIIDLGVRYAPEERVRSGIVSDFTLSENLILRNPQNHPILDSFLIDYNKLNHYATKILEEFNVNPPNPIMKASKLSGGNLQKLILARELSCKPKILIAHQITAGLDIMATRFIHKKLLELKKKKSALVLISSDLFETIEMCDRIGVLYKGILVAILPRGEFDEEKLGFLMSGRGLENKEK